MQLFFGFGQALRLVGADTLDRNIRHQRNRLRYIGKLHFKVDFIFLIEPMQLNLFKLYL